MYTRTHVCTHTHILTLTNTTTHTHTHIHITILEVVDSSRSKCSEAGKIKISMKVIFCVFVCVCVVYTIMWSLNDTVLNVYIII